MKWIHVVGLMVITALFSIGGTYLILEGKYEKELSKMIDEMNESLQKEMALKEAEPFVSTVDVIFGGENIAQSKILDEWKSGDKPFFENGVAGFEYAVQEIIQCMAHQKVIADEKDCSVMITPERIDTVIELVEENKDDLEHDETYLEVLNRWKKGDFSIVDYDHNVVKYLQGSNIGEGLATGIASKEQEIDYIFRVFSKRVDDVFGSSEKK